MSRKRHAGGGGELRIIGGRWRGRKLAFPEVEGLRPTPDRVRETLFNWLAPVISGARCLDLYAGSGALALEALSRGAAHVVMVERDPRVAARLREHLDTLGAAPQATVHLADAAHYLAQSPPRPFDVVFLDPPFHGGHLGPALVALDCEGWLAPQARVYLEAEAQAGAPPLPVGWTLARARVAGQVGYYLAVRPGPAQPAVRPGPGERHDDQGGLSGEL